MASIEREKFPELPVPVMNLPAPEVTSTSPEPGKCSDLSDVGDNDSGYSDD